MHRCVHKQCSCHHHIVFFRYMNVACSENNGGNDEIQCHVLRCKRCKKMFNTCTWHVLNGDWKSQTMCQKCTITSWLCNLSSTHRCVHKQCSCHHHIVYLRYGTFWKSWWEWWDSRPCVEMQTMQKMFNTCTRHVLNGDWKNHKQCAKSVRVERRLKQITNKCE